MRALNIYFATLALLIISTTDVNGQFYLQVLKYNDYEDTFKEKYFDQLDRGEIITKSGYHFVASENKDKKCFIRVFYPETKQIVSHEQYEDNNFEVKSGYAKYWYENGNKMSEGYYKNDQRVGQWKLYNSKNGSLSSTGIYRSNKKNGIWTDFEAGDTSAIYTFVNDVREGPFIEYDSTGSIANQGAYEGDIIYSENKLSTSTNTSLIIEEPLYKHGDCDQIENYKERKKCADKALLEHIYSRLRYPNSAREYGIQGRVILQLTINNEGLLEDYQVLKGICDDLKNESLRVIQTLPMWRPGTRDGVPVKSTFTLPIQFRINN